MYSLLAAQQPRELQDASMPVTVASQGQFENAICFSAWTMTDVCWLPDTSRIKRTAVQLLAVRQEASLPLYPC